jgi:hypothetical protein
VSLTVSTTSLSAEIDLESGRLIAVRNLTRDLDLIAAPPANAPFRLELQEIGWVEGFTGFANQPIADGVRLTWETAHAVTMVSDVTARGDDLLITIVAYNHGRATVLRIEYPIIANIGRLGGRGQDELVHSHATGMLFRDPLDLFEPDPGNRRRLRYSPYPEGFHGSTMQMLAYYARNRGGFLIGTEDRGQALKWFNVFKEGGLLRSTIIHAAPLVSAGEGIAPDYPVVLAPLSVGTWYEAADRYKAWALEQPWAQATPRGRWLRERVGICTFGINAAYDRASWLDALHRTGGTPVFHILGPNWPMYGQDYRNHFPRGRADWFPATFSGANLAAIRRNGDFWAPFEFDLLCNDTPDLPDPVLASRVMQPAGDPGFEEPRFPYMCAGTDYWHDLHVWRDERLVADHRCDALYYDISVSNLRMQCVATNHRHAPGTGTAVASAFASMYRDTREAVERAMGAHVPMGTEAISECFVREFDYYQARAEACPLAPFEVDAFRDWIVEGRAEKIPLFTYVYHERGPLRLDGWAKLAREAGDLFYWTAARILLNGGLLELNYEFSGLENLDGRTDNPDEHYFPFVPRLYAIDPEKAAFVGEVARTRVGRANPFLAYGTMLPAPVVEAPTVDLDYFLYGVAPGPHYAERGSMRVPSVLAAAWQYSGRTAWLVANLVPAQQTARVDGKPISLPPRHIALVEH